MERPDGGSTEGWRVESNDQQLPQVYDHLGRALATTVVSAFEEGENTIMEVRVEIPDAPQ